MIEKILFNVIAFSLFTIIFLLKLVKKNDTTYLTVIIAEAIGIAINFISILTGVWDGTIIRIIMYLLAIVIPIIVIVLEKNGVNVSDNLNIFISKIYIMSGNTKKAKEHLIVSVSKYPNSCKSHKMLAEIYEKEGGIRKAIDEYTKIIEIDKTTYDIQYKVAYLLRDSERKEEAVQVLSNILNNKPEHLEATKMLGELLLEQEQYKEAVSVYASAIRYSPNDYDLYYSLGLAYTMLNDFQSAKEYYEKAAQINHELHNGYYCLGKISLLYRDLEGAEENFAKSLMGELEADSYYELAKIYMIKNERDKAITFVNKAIELDGKYVEIVKNEPIFIIVRQYINLPINVLEETKKQVELSSKEQKAIEHLDNVYELTKSLTVNEIKQNFMEKRKKQEKENEMHKGERQIDI